MGDSEDESKLIPTDRVLEESEEKHERIDRKDNPDQYPGTSSAAREQLTEKQAIKLQD